MRQLIGVVERLTTIAKSGPSGRLRPLFQLSQDKTQWIPLEEEFPNSGLVSWWQPSSDANSYKVCLFHVEPSPTYDSDNANHDYYRVKGSPIPAVELIELANADDPESVRQLLVEEGIALECCATRQVVLRDRQGSLIGPVDLVLRESKLYLNQARFDVLLSEQQAHVGVASWEKHQFLPPEGWGRKVGQIDFSPDGIFLKRALREIKNSSPEAIAKAKLTEKLISEYCESIENTSATQIQQQRLRRLRRMAEKSAKDVIITEEAVADLLALKSVQDVISKAKQDAASEAVAAVRLSLTELQAQRSQLMQQIDDLNEQIQNRRAVLVDLEKQNAATIAGFDQRIQGKFQEITRDASSFLAEIALVRAALQTPESLPTLASDTKAVSSRDFGTIESIAASTIVSAVQNAFNNAGLSCRTGSLLLASLASGFVPIVHGVLGSDSLRTLGESLFTDRTYWLTLHSTLSSPGELLKIPVASGASSKTLEEVLASIGESAPSLMVLENLNLSQIDSVIVPLLRRYSDQQSRTAASLRRYATPAGIWPSNLLLAGLVTDSPLSLPLSRELWCHGTLVDATSSCNSNRRGGAGDASESNVAGSVSTEEWMRWQNVASDKEPTDTVLLATFMNRQIQASSTFKHLLKRLAVFVDLMDQDVPENKTSLLAEMAIIPYLVSRGVDVRTMFKNSPIETPEQLIDSVTSLFQRWGIDLI